MIAYFRSPESVADGVLALFNWKPTKDIVNDGGCPRTWTHVGRMWNAGLRQFEVIAGAVGKANATSFLNFVELAEKAPSLEEILLTPDTASIPDKASLNYLVATALGRAITQGNFDRAMIYLKRLSQQFRFLAIQDMLRDAPRAAKARQTSAFIEWSLDEGKQLMAGWKT